MTHSLVFGSTKLPLRPARCILALAMLPFKLSMLLASLSFQGEKSASEWIRKRPCGARRLVLIGETPESSSSILSSIVSIPKLSSIRLLRRIRDTVGDVGTIIQKLLFRRLFKLRTSSVSSFILKKLSLPLSLTCCYLGLQDFLKASIPPAHAK